VFRKETTFVFLGWSADDEPLLTISENISLDYGSAIMRHSLHIVSWFPVSGWYRDGGLSIACRLLSLRLLKMTWKYDIGVNWFILLRCFPLGHNVLLQLELQFCFKLNMTLHWSFDYAWYLYGVSDSYTLHVNAFSTLSFWYIAVGEHSVSQCHNIYINFLIDCSPVESLFMTFNCRWWMRAAIAIANSCHVVSKK